MFFEVILKKGQKSKQIDRERKMTNARNERKVVATDPRAIKKDYVLETMYAHKFHSRAVNGTQLPNTPK